MLRTNHIICLLALSFVACLGISAFAEDTTTPDAKPKIECPAFTDKKPAGENYLEWFCGKTKTGYESNLIFQITCNNKPCLLYESNKVMKGQCDGKEYTREQITRLIVSADDYTPVYGEQTDKSEGLTVESRVLVSKKDDCLMFTARDTTNGKTMEKVFQGNPREHIYFLGSSPEIFVKRYLPAMPKEKAFYFRFYSLEAFGFMFGTYTLKEKKKITWESKETEILVVEYGPLTLWLTLDGIVLRASNDNFLESYRSATAENYKKFDRTLDDYKAPDFVENNLAVSKTIGFTVNIPDGVYAVTKFDENMGLSSPFVGGYVELDGNAALPDKVDREAFVKHWHDLIGNAFVPAAGKTKEINGVKCLTGEFTGTDNFGVGLRGVYYAFVENGCGILVRAGAPDDLWDKRKDTLIKCAESIKLTEQSPKPAAQTFTSEKFGLKVSAPTAIWTFRHERLEDNEVFYLRNTWNNADASVVTRKLKEGETAEKALADFKKGPAEDKDCEVIEDVKTKISGIDALGVRYSITEHGAGKDTKYVAVHIFFVRGDTLYRWEAFCLDKEYDNVKDDYAKILGSLTFTKSGESSSQPKPPTPNEK